MLYRALDLPRPTPHFEKNTHLWTVQLESITLERQQWNQFQVALFGLDATFYNFSSFDKEAVSGWNVQDVENLFTL